MPVSTSCAPKSLHGFGLYVAREVYTKTCGVYFIMSLLQALLPLT